MLSNFIYAHSRQVTFENIVDNHCVIFFWHELVIDLRVPKRCSVGDISLRRISTSDTPSPPLISLNLILNVISAKTLH